jgi:predicted nucleic acid-binding Zn ribbon protein
MPKKTRYIYPKQVCEVCKKDYIPSRGGQRFCSQRCSRDHAKKNRLGFWKGWENKDEI